MPAPVHGGEHADDWMSSNAMLLSAVPLGSCDKSATESHRMRRSAAPEPAATAAHTFEESITEPAAVDEESRVTLLVGSAVKVAGPE